MKRRRQKWYKGKLGNIPGLKGWQAEKMVSATLNPDGTPARVWYYIYTESDLQVGRLDYTGTLEYTIPVAEDVDKKVRDMNFKTSDGHLDVNKAAQYAYLMLQSPLPTGVKSLKSSAGKVQSKILPYLEEQ